MTTIHYLLYSPDLKTYANQYGGLDVPLEYAHHFTPDLLEETRLRWSNPANGLLSNHPLRNVEIIKVEVSHTNQGKLCP